MFLRSRYVISRLYISYIKWLPFKSLQETLALGPKANFSFVCNLVLLHICNFQKPFPLQSRLQFHLVFPGNPAKYYSKMTTLFEGPFICLNPRRLDASLPLLRTRPEHPALAPGAMLYPVQTPPFLALVVFQWLMLSVREPQKSSKKNKSQVLVKHAAALTLAPQKESFSFYKAFCPNPSPSFVLVWHDLYKQRSKARSRSKPLQLNRVRLGDNSSETVSAQAH